MAILDDSVLAGQSAIERNRPAGLRRVSVVLHDVDGTHSLIRQWPPVMSAVVGYAMTCGLADDFDSPEGLDWLQANAASVRTAETDRFCTESAGLSALTQMEFAIRRAIELGNVPAGAGFALDEKDLRNNSEICRRIWTGEERFGDVPEPAGLLAFINERTPRLFRFYENLLNRESRDRNLELARVDPAAWRVPGSLEFIAHLSRIGCVNYFVTGAVIFQGGGMFEEIEALGYSVGPGRMIEAVVGSSWDRKLPKDELFRELLASQKVPPGEVLVIGDGRTEIRAGIEMGCTTISRLEQDAARLRQLHRQIGTNYILADYTEPKLTEFIRPE